MTQVKFYSNDIPVEISLTNFGEEFGDYTAYQKFSEFLLDYFGYEQTESILEQIISIRNHFIVEVNGRRFLLETHKGTATLKEYIDPIREILKNQRFITEKYLNEILNFFEQNIDKTSKDNDSSLSYKGIWIGYKSDYYFVDQDEFKKRMSKYCGKKIISETLTNFKEELTDNTLCIVLGDLVHYKLIITDALEPTLKKFSENFSKNLSNLLIKKGYSQQEVIEILFDSPKRIPKGFRYLTGNLRTGYVITDDDGNEFVYLPESNVYISRYPISQTSTGKLVSVSNARPLLFKCENPKTGYGFNNPQDEEKYMTTFLRSTNSFSENGMEFANMFNLYNEPFFTNSFFFSNEKDMIFNIHITDGIYFSNSIAEIPDPDFPGSCNTENISPVQFSAHNETITMKSLYNEHYKEHPFYLCIW